MELIEFGKVEGYITALKRGHIGLGYDPIFMPKGYKLTFVELSQQKKAKISHRSRALNKKLRAYLNYNRIIIDKTPL